VCFFCYDSEPRYGYVFIGFDTLENNIRCALELQRHSVERRKQNLTGRITWEWAKHQLKTPVLDPFNTNSGDFAYREYAEADFPAWRALAESGDYPRGADHEDDYLESNGRLVLWRTAERLL